MVGLRVNLISGSRLGNGGFAGCLDWNLGNEPELTAADARWQQRRETAPQWISRVNAIDLDDRCDVDVEHFPIGITRPLERVSFGDGRCPERARGVIHQPNMANRPTRRFPLTVRAGAPSAPSGAFKKHQISSNLSLISQSALRHQSILGYRSASR